MSIREPRVGCGAAILSGGRILLLRRRKDPEAGCWGLLGGKVDWMEPAEQAAIREAQEEMGILIRPDRLLCVVDHIEPDKDEPWTGEHWVAPVYLVTDFEGEPRIQEPDKHSDWGWFALDALPDELTVAVRFAVRALGHTPPVTTGRPAAP